jgi:RsiW-degrading membrane proteinase PrsW (M82 family)
MESPIVFYLLSGVLAIIPAFIWLLFLFRRTKRKGLQIGIFLTSILAVFPVLAIQYFVDFFSQFEIYRYISARIPETSLMYVILFVFVGVIEEIAKQLIVRTVDKYKLIIQTINESIQFSLIAALGFSFAENAFYFYSIYTQLGAGQLFVSFIFRSVFTTCAHLIFSGFFGYYYGIAKFSLNIVEQTRIIGKKQRISSWLAEKLDITTFEAYKQLTILKGAMIAISMHAVFNLLLQFNQLIIVVLYIILSFIILRRLFYRRSGRLILISEKEEGKESTMPKKDEDVVIELLGMWFKENRFVDVIHICQRLLERDPGNKVVQLFKAQAVDKIGSNDVYGKILNNIFPDKNVKSIMVLIKEKGKEEIKNPIQQQKFEPDTLPAPKPAEPDHFDLKL